MGPELVSRINVTTNTGANSTRYQYQLSLPHSKFPISVLASRLGVGSHFYAFPQYANSLRMDKSESFHGNYPQYRSPDSTLAPHPNLYDTEMCCSSDVELTAGGVLVENEVRFI